MVKKTAFTPLPPAALRPTGWLRRQLEIQAAGLSGHLDQVWPDIRDSAWIGGGREGWERVPYWLDGFIPLAWLLDDGDMKARAKRYIDCILARQQEDGWICPCGVEERARYDMWAYILIAKVLTVYADCSGDGRVQPALTRAMRCFALHIDRHTIFDWAAARWFECLIPIFWLYERTGEAWLLDLAHRLEVQGIDYRALFDNYADEQPRRHWTFLTHVVNLAMCLKSDALVSLIKPRDPDAFARKARETLLRYHGMAAAHFTGDECVSGTSPIQGSELCGVVEAMYSYETLLRVGGSSAWGDALEQLAFNALPAAFSPDMWTHQYDQMTNQIECSAMPDERVVFGTNSGESHLFGLEPNFGCCTANFSQAWPKLALSAFQRTEEGLVSAVLVPAEARCEIRGIGVACRLETEYPFRGALTYTVETEAPVSFPLLIRIPSFAASATVDGEPVATGAFHTAAREWRGTTTIHVELAFDCSLQRRSSGMYCLWRGPLLYCAAPQERWVRREYTRDGVERKHPYCDYEVYAAAPWNYAFYAESFFAEEHGISQIPFSPGQPPVTVAAEMVRIRWDAADGVCEETPEGTLIPDSRTRLNLIPYGCSNLRMTEMPLIREREGERTCVQ